MNDKYLQYSLEDFLNDSDFISDFRDQKLDLSQMQAFVKDHPSAKTALNEALVILETLTSKSEHLPAERVDALWSGIKQTIVTKDKKKSHVVRYLTISAIAASLIFIIGLTWLFTGQYKQISTFAGEQVEYSLPDNSEISLNALSYLKFDRRNFKESRTLEMRGEANFRVTKRGSFQVQTSKGIVKVLGTVFNVYDRDSIFEVQCFEGQVLTITNKNDSSYLKANMGLRFNEATSELKIDKVYSEAQRSWTRDRFKFINSPLPDVLTELQHQFNVQLITEPGIDLTSRHYTGSFTNQDLETALQSVLWPMHLEFKIMGKQVIISHP
jgi:ferric-dicitrate binding protein FerR (iron transport regulator)